MEEETVRRRVVHWVMVRGRGRVGLGWGKGQGWDRVNVGAWLGL